MQQKDIQKIKFYAILKNISNNLKKFRVNLALTQEEVSFKIGISSRNYQYIETNKIRDIKLSTILKILDFFNITLEDLIK